MIDLLLGLLLLAWVSWSNLGFCKKNRFSVFFKWTLMGLWCYHLLFGVIFYYYIGHFGGDSSGYWYLKADLGFLDWVKQFGTGTNFVQWLNYLPSRVFGLHYITGTLIYACLSFLGFRELMLLLVNRYGREGKDWKNYIWVVLLFMPNLHFWTAGVTKEALLWLGLVLVIKGLVHFPRDIYWLLTGLVLSLMIRPFHGLVLSITLLGFLPFQPLFSLYRRKAILIAGFLILGIFVFKWVQGSLVYGFNFQWISEILKWQEGFLKSFDAGSEVPMHDYGWLAKIGTVLFRPLWWEMNDFWTFAAALENSLFLVIMVLGLMISIKVNWKEVPVFLWAGMVFGCGMVLLYALTLNNLGIMMRMKSTFMVFFALLVYDMAFLIKKNYFRN